jgi:hypothetical protein
MYFYCYDLVFLLYVYVWLPWLRFFHAFFSVVRQIPGQNPQRRGTARTLPNFCVVLCIFFVLCIFVLFYVLFVLCRSLLFVCICVLYDCHRLATQLQLNISYHIYCGGTARSGPGCHIMEASRSHWHTTLGRTPLDEWSARRRDLTAHNTQQETDVHASSGIRTCNPNTRTAARPRLRPLGPRDWRLLYLLGLFFPFPQHATQLFGNSFRKVVWCGVACFGNGGKF